MKLGKQWIKRIAPSDDPEAWVPAVSEIPAGSSCKYRLDKETGHLTMAGAFSGDIHMPCNYGFVPHTRSSADGKEMDVLIVSHEPLQPLTVVRARIIGGYVETSSDADEPEARLVAVAVDDPSVSLVHDLPQLDRNLRDQIEVFTQAYKQQDDVDVTFDGWFDRAVALDHLRRAMKRAEKRAPA